MITIFLATFIIRISCKEFVVFSFFASYRIALQDLILQIVTEKIGLKNLTSNTIQKLCFGLKTNLIEWVFAGNTAANKRFSASTETR